MKMTMRTEVRGAESSTSVALGGIIVVAFGTFAVMASIGEGWLVAGVLGLVFLLVGRKVPTSSRTLPLIVSGLGIAALLGAAIDLFV